MPEGFARVAAVSVPVHLGDVQANVNEISAAMEKLRQKGVQAAVFPELCLTGATLGDLILRPEVINAAWKGLLSLAKKAGKMAVVVGLPVNAGGRLYNCSAILHDGRVQAFVPQTNPDRPFASGSSIFSEIEIYGDDVAMTSEIIFEVGCFRFGVEIGEDAHALEPNATKLIRGGADIILHTAASKAAFGKQDRRKAQLCKRSARLHAGFVYAGAGFGESTGDHVYDGATIIAENGEVLAEGERFQLEGGMAIADVDVEMLRFQRMKSEAFRRLPEMDMVVHTLGMTTNAVLPLRRSYEPLPFVPKTGEGLEEIAQIQCMGLASRLKAIRCENLVIGVSGGLDSTLALLVAARTFDLLGISRKGIHAITMPGMGTGARTKTNADRLMEALGVSASEIPIGPAVKQHFADIGQPEGKHDVTYENSQARERTQILMDYANKVNGIVLGTGDLSEEALGFCTYNGDHMSMYNVNCTVTKTCLRSLTCYLSAHSFDAEVAAICQDVVDTPVSPELLPVTEGELNQRTEDILGDYALHDFFLYHYMESGASRAKLQLLAEHAFRGVYDAEKIAAQLKTFIWRFYTQQFKRSCAPDGPQVGPVSLSPRGGWDAPSDIKPIG